MMNLELLFFASKQTGDPVYKDIAIKHAETAMKNQIREDYSSFHVVCYDTLTGKVVGRKLLKAMPIILLGQEVKLGVFMVLPWFIVKQRIPDF